MRETLETRLKNKELSDSIDYKGKNYSLNGVFVFDFDGVLASIDEHDVYDYSLVDLLPYAGEEKKQIELDKLVNSETELIDRACSHWEIKSAGVDAKYIRHLVFQRALRLNKRKIMPGPYLKLAQRLSLTGRLIVLTARSEWSAVERARNFLQYHDIRVHEFFSVGRGNKIQQFNDIVREASNARMPVYFFDDNEAHIKDLKKVAAHNKWAIETEKVIPDRASSNKKSITSQAKEFFFKEVNEALKLKEHSYAPDQAQTDLFKPLSHARDLFIYHAGQRHTSIRYFQLAYGAIAAGYGVLLTGVYMGPLQGVGLTLVALLGIFLCRFFIRLDKRNGDLVECDENAIKELERKIGDKHVLSKFSIMDEMEVATIQKHQYRKNIDGFIDGLQGVSLAGVFVGIHTVLATCTSYGFFCISQ